MERPQHRMLPSYQPDYYPYVQHHPSSPADGLCVTYDAGYDWHPPQQPYSDYGRYGYTTYAVRYDHKDPNKGVYAATPTAGPETNALGCGSSAARAPAALACQAPSVLTPDKTALRTPKAERSRGRKSGSQGSKAEGKERSAEGQGIPDQNGTVPASLPEGSRSTTEPQEPHKMSGINPDVAHNPSSTPTASHGQSATVLTPPQAPPNRRSPRDATINAATANAATANAATANAVNANATTSPEAPGSRAPPTLWNRSEEQGEVAARGSGGPVAARGGKSSRGRGGGGGGGGGGTGVTWMQQGRTSLGSERECWRAPTRVLSKAGESPDSGIGSTPNGTPSSTSSPSSHPSERRPRNADERRSRGALPGRGDPRRSDARAEAGAHNSTRGPPAPRVEPEPRDGVPRGRDVQDRADRGSKRSRGGAGRSPCDGADRGFHGRADRGSSGGAVRGPHSGVNKGSIDGASKVLPDGASKGSGDRAAKWPQGDDKALTDEVSKGLPVAGLKESHGGATGWPGARTPTRDMAVACSSEPSDEGSALAAPDRISWPELGAARGDRSWSLGKDGGSAVNGPRPQHGALPGDRTLPTPPTPTVMTWAKVASRPPPLPAPRGPPVSQAAWTSTSTSGRGQQAESSDEDDGGGGGSKKKTQRKKKKSKKKAPKTTVAETPPPHVEPLRFQDDEEFPGLSASLGPRRLPMARPGFPAAGTTQQPQTSVPKKGSGKKSKAPVTLDLGDVLATFERQQHEQQEIAEANAAAAAATSSSALPTSHGSTHLATSRPAKPIISVGTASAPLPKKETLLGSSKKSGRGGPAPHNPLDSSAPAVKRGKERETPRAKKPTTLKKVILKEREERKRRRLCEERGLVYVPGGDSPASDADARKDEGGEGKDEGKAESKDEGGEGKDEGGEGKDEGKAEGKDEGGEGKAEEGTEPVDADNDDETEAETESELETEQETEAESDAERPMGGSPADVEPPDTPQDSSADPNGNQATDVDEDGRESPSPVVRAELPPPGPKIHSRRFRDYCNQVLSREIDQCASAMLLELVRFQERLFERDPERARRKRRLVMGLREVTKHLRLRKLRALIISPNCEKIQAKGGLDEALQTVIALASEQSVPFVFALNRKALGHCLNKKVPVSVVGVFHYGGAETHFQRLVALTEEARSAYRDMVSSLQQQEAGATNESTGHTEDPLEASASPPSVPAHDPTALLHLLRLPQGHREEDPAEGSGRSPGRNARGAAETERRMPAACGGGDDRDEGDDRGGVGGKRPDTNLCQDGVTAVWSGAGRGGVG
ncbi:collagen alpha-1(I) chain-like isoform X2 [Lethenteron reissneri]|nr:collagen alpha-1(I) chain-like isoform X2 [Lethenteron reissneri]